MKGHVLPSYKVRVIKFPGPDGADHRVRSGRHGATPPDMNRPKPAWHILYIGVALTLLLFVVADIESPVGAWRILTEFLATLLIIGVVALWMRVNRLALALTDATRSGGRDLGGSMADSPDSCQCCISILPQIESSQGPRVHPRPAEEEDAKCLAK